MDKVRVGLIGAGSIGVRHMKAMGEVPEITLVAIADLSPAAVKIGAAQDIPIYPDAGAMLAQGDLDAVIIATPTERHHQDMMMALESRQTVLVEKPITATLAEADEVTRFAEQQGCHVLVGHQRRYYPCAAEAREIIAQGRIGKLMGVTGQWTTRKDDDYYNAAWRRDVKAGPILTNLIHEIDLLRFICGDIATVSAEVTHHDQEFDKEDAVAISMKFVNSAVGTFSAVGPDADSLDLGMALWRKRALSKDRPERDPVSWNRGGSRFSKSGHFGHMPTVTATGMTKLRLNKSRRPLSMPILLNAGICAPSSAAPRHQSLTQEMAANHLQRPWRQPVQPPAADVYFWNNSGVGMEDFL